MNLEFLGQYKEVATILVVITCIVPYVADFFLKCVPALQEGRPCRRFSTFDPSHKLLNAFEGDWVLYDLIIIYKSSRGKMDERCKDCLIPIAINQRVQARQYTPTYSASV